MKSLPTLVTIEGPTAVGKTALAIQVAQALNTEIISADSRQFYNELNIGVARPEPNELAAAKHHFIGFLPIEETYNAGAFERDALTLLQELFQSHDFVVCVGGSGLYVQALVQGLDEIPGSPEVREQLMKTLSEDGIEALQRQLKVADEAYFHEVDIQNPHRLIRALEVCIVTGKKYSELRLNKTTQRDFQVVPFAMDADRAWLYERINMRVDRMMEQGLLDEAKALFPKRHLNALNTVGYKELFDFIEGKTTLEEALNLIKQHTRNYAKRQLTWLRRNSELNWIEANKPDESLQRILEMLKK
jgi:tRNA dimethylallyltransferase